MKKSFVTIIRLLLSLLGAGLLIGCMIEKNTIDGAIIEQQIYLILYIIGGILLAAGLMLRPILKACKRYIVVRIFALIPAAAMLFIFFTAGVVLTASLTVNGADGSEKVMLIMGAPVVDDTPTATLTSRALCASDWIKSHPDTFVVISGGKGEPRTEAQTISDLIGEQGIDTGSFLLENNATSTHENFLFVKNMAAETLSETDSSILVVTNGFHVYRTKLFAKQTGMDNIHFLTASTPSSVRLLWFGREIVLTIRFWLLGY